MKMTRYALKYDYVEQVLLNLGKDYRIIESEFKSYENGIIKSDTPLVFTIRRSRYLEHVKRCLEEIYNDVNDETRELIDSLYMKGLGFKETAIKTGLKEERLYFRHNLLVEEMMILLGEVSEGESKQRVIRRRPIPTNIRNEVFKRDNGRCVECHSGEKLHYHHIKRYAQGGKDTVDNLILLCASCHAEEHREESAYPMLKVMAER